MNVGFNQKKAIEHAVWLAKTNGVPYRVFHCYMPSVYRVDRSPFFVEPRPEWHKDREPHWVEEMRNLNCHIVMPNGQVLEPITPPWVVEELKKKAKRRKRKAK